MLLNVLACLAMLTSSLQTGAVPLEGRALPTPISAAQARTVLAGLTVAVDSNVPAYSRTLFPTWEKISGHCNTRDVVLKRDGTNVVTDSSCKAISGTWVSAYDNATWTTESKLDIDHLVPLKEAWLSGARDWTTPQRQAFANDLTRPQLIAVTDTINESKGNKDPAQWVPPVTSFVCTYVQAWVQVKGFYNLTMDSAEQAALTNILAGC